MKSTASTIKSLTANFQNIPTNDKQKILLKNSLECNSGTDIQIGQNYNDNLSYMPRESHINKLLYQIKASCKLSYYKRRRTGKPISYYPNSTATHHILLSGDIEINPGPQQKSAKCRVCEKTVKSNHKRFLCDICQDLTHAICTGLTQIKQIRACTPNNWICSHCISSILPFHTERSIDFDNSIGEIHNSSLMSTPNSDIHLSELESRQKSLRVAHLNTL